MSLSIGIEVKRQVEGPMCAGRNPKGTREEIEERLWDVLNTRFPDGGFGVGITIAEDHFDFSVQFRHYGDQFTAMDYDMDDMRLALTGFILDNFSTVDDIHMRIWHSA